MRLNTKKTRIIASIAAICLAFVVGIWVYGNTSRNASAGGNAHNPVSPTNPGCTSICYSKTVMGVAWIFYPFDGGYGYDAGSQTVNAPNTHAGALNVANCIEAGATGYYRLGWVWYYKSSGLPAVVNGVYQYGYFLASDVSYEGGSGIYYDAIAGHSLGQIGATDWSTARNNFAVAEAYGATDGLSWPNVSMFCFNPEWTDEEPDPSSGNGYFESKSKITAVAGGDVPGGIEAETEWDGTGEIRYSTDQASVNVKFQHSMRYVNVDIPTHDEHCAGDNHCFSDTYEDAETEYKVTTTMNGADSEAGSGDYSSPANEDAGPDEKYNNTVSVSLNPGETKIVCQTISYKDKNFTFTENPHVESGTDTSGTPPTSTPWTTTWHSYDDPEGSGQGFSRVCATITRPSGPDTGDGTGGTGSTDSNIMYAGEQAQISWSVSGINNETRRLLGWEAVVYRIPVTVDYSSSLHTGTRGPLNGIQSNSVCQWYGSWDYCNVLSSRSGSFGTTGQSHSYNEAAVIVVPDTVGYKYCNSFGYHYQYFWYSSNSGWHEDKLYWRVHDASCRTIAKKPSTGIWNGSMLTAGGVSTSSSPRYNNAIMGIETSAGGSRTLYGSWSEYLAAVGKSVNAFSSASNFAIGSSDLTAPRSNDRLNNSRLTISNKSRLGSSGISNNSAYLTRLTTFMENQATPIGDTLGATTVTGTQIMKHTGTLKITGNIVTAPGPYRSIYHIPQAVIFVRNGDVEIASDVTRIDAWLIVTNGKINTCSNFQSGTTESDAIGRPRDTCNKQLVFNGPVMANRLELNRSFGSDPLISYRTGTFGAPSTKYAAGEVFNLRADTYLWAYAQAGRYDSSYTESYSRELAPRY